jgi:NAD(P)-dependent dehydrogenase (short-subunit alcohol dehydrogenase family)
VGVDQQIRKSHRLTDEFLTQPSFHESDSENNDRQPQRRRHTMSTPLHGKNAIIYGGGGDIGAAVASTFAREGARVFLVGRTAASLDAAAAGAEAAGGAAETAVVDALDEQAVDEHLADVAARAGSVDISFNLVSRGDVQGVPLVDMTADDLLCAVDNGLRTSFLTARAAARQMGTQGSGVILHLNSASGAGAMPGMGSTGPADAAVEAFMRYLAAEVGPLSVRVCGVWTAGVEETLTNEKMATVSDTVPDAQTVIKMISSMAALRRTPRLADVAETAAFLASDRAAGITGSMTNVTAGLVLR